VPVFALDLNSSAPKKWLVLMFVIAGVLASLSYTVEWLDRRSLADLPVSRIALPSGQLRTALYVYGLTGALLADKNRAAWTALTALTLSLTWITGNRADSLLLLSAVPLVAIFAMRHERRAVGPAVRVMTLGGTAVVLTVALTQPLATFSDYDAAALSDRYGTIATVSAEPSSDASYQHREDQTRLAWRTFLSQPALGVGPGHTFEWTNVNGLPRSSFHIDTSLSFLSKYGVVGLVLLLALVVAFASFLKNASHGSRLTAPQLALVGYAALAILAMPFSTPLEDKGFSFGLLFLLALSLPRESRAQKDDGTPQSNSLGRAE
jgi:O-antigen ligase